MRTLKTRTSNSITVKCAVQIAQLIRKTPRFRAAPNDVIRHQSEAGTGFHDFRQMSIYSSYMKTILKSKLYLLNSRLESHSYVSCNKRATIPHWKTFYFNKHQRKMREDCDMTTAVRQHRQFPAIRVRLKCLAVFRFFKSGFLRDFGSIKMRKNHHVIYSHCTFRIFNKINKV